MLQNLDVYLWDNKVGTLVAYKEKYKEKLCFYFDEGYKRRGLDIAPLRCPIESVSGLPIYGEEDKMYGGLPSFIADSLPDRWGNTVFAEWAKSRHIRQRDLSSLDRLAYIGCRGMGALEFVPAAAAEMETPFKVDMEGLYALAQSALNEAKRFRADMNADLLIESLFKVGTSAGGRRPKAIINVNLQTGECYSGQVSSPEPGYIPMIVKFDEHSGIPTTRIEYSYYLMAADVGMKMMPSQLVEGEDSVHFMTERFDRRAGEKIHIQTLAAMNPGATTYEELFETACRVRIPPAELHLLYVQMVMNVACGNVDDHNKNFSFMMGKDGIWHIAPAYDFTFSVDPSAPGYINRHCMTVNGKNNAIEREDLLCIAKDYNIRGAGTIIEKVIAVVSCYSKYAALAGVNEYWTRKIEEEIDERIAFIDHT